MESAIKILAIVQARMSSKRLPGKVLYPLAGRPVIEHIVNRLRKSIYIDKIVIATSNDNSDNQIEDWCNINCVEIYRGSLDDVLDRFYQAANQYKARNVLRITADCPVIDFKIIDEVIENYFASDFDYYGLQGEFPDGLDCTIISYNSLKTAWENAKLPSEREHVGPYIEKNYNIFKLGGFQKFKGLGHLRWTLDEKRDYDFLQNIFNELYSNGNDFLHDEILELLIRKPFLLNINSDITRNEGYLNSLQNDNN